MTNFCFLPGDQVAYFPDHADSIHHPDVEFGFIVSICPDGDASAFVRYWSKHLRTLRTTANSERTRLKDLIPHRSVSNAEVIFAITKYVSPETAIRIMAAFSKRTHVQKGGG